MGRNKSRNKQRTKRGDRSTAEIEKAFALKVIETVEALQILRDAVRQVREGKWYHLPVLSGQMRSLLIDKAAHSERRLFFVAERLGMKPHVFCMLSVDDPNFPLQEKVLFWVAGFPITAERQLEAQIEVPFDEVLTRPFVLYQGIRYSARTIIEWFANKAGGAHYSSSLPKQFAEMLTLKVGDLAPLRQMLVQLAEATLVVGLKLLRAATQQELHLVLVVPETPSRETYLLDAAYPGSPMRFSLMLDKRGVPIARLVGLDGSQIQVVGNRLVTWDRPHHLQLSVSVTDDLHTHLDLCLDGSSLGWAEVKAPVFITSDWLDFDVVHNKATDSPPQDFGFGLAELLQVGHNLSPSDRANMLLYEERKRCDPDLKLVFYGARSFGRSPPGKRNLTMNGTVKHISVAELLAKLS